MLFIPQVFVLFMRHSHNNDESYSARRAKALPVYNEIGRERNLMFLLHSSTQRHDKL